MTIKCKDEMGGSSPSCDTRDQKERRDTSNVLQIESIRFGVDLITVGEEREG